jgi:hypothetical protein
MNTQNTPAFIKPVVYGGKKKAKKKPKKKKG